MNKGNFQYGFRAGLALLLVAALTGCSGSPVQSPLWLLHPNGPIATASVHYLLIDVLLLLIVIVPATALTIWAFWRYRRNGKGEYDPTFNHSITVEVVVWGIPLLLVVFLAYFSFQGTRAVAPFNPQALNSVVAKNNHQKPLKINVITTDWQWLFVYPQLHIAMANRLVVPTGRKISMDLTSVSVTNDFYVLKVINQIYIMPGMRSKQHFYLDRPGVYQGYSTEFSGPGFSWMNYKMLSVTPQQFQRWVQRARQSGNQMNWSDFVKFAKPTINTGNTWKLYGAVDPNLFKQVMHQVRAGKLHYTWPMDFSDDMTTKKFARLYGTGKAKSAPEGTVANQPQKTLDR